MDWGSTIADVTAAIAEVGFDATITRAGATTGPEWAPAAGEPVTHDIRVIDARIKVKDTAGGFTGLTRRAITFAAGNVTPIKGDTLTVRGVAHTVDEIETLATGGVDVLYRVVLEK